MQIDISQQASLKCKTVEKHVHKCAGRLRQFEHFQIWLKKCFIPNAVQELGLGTRSGC